MVVVLRDAPREPRDLVSPEASFLPSLCCKNGLTDGSRFCNTKREENRLEAIPAAPGAACSGLLQGPPPWFGQKAPLHVLDLEVPTSMPGSILKRSLALLQLHGSCVRQELFQGGVGKLVRPRYQRTPAQRWPL